MLYLLRVLTDSLIQTYLIMGVKYGFLCNKKTITGKTKGTPYALYAKISDFFLTEFLHQKDSVLTYEFTTTYKENLVQLIKFKIYRSQQ